MARLILHLFGAPQIEIDGSPLEVDTRKATALLAYLAVTGETHQRDTLAGLLWPDYDQSSARAALRRTLSTLNRALEGKQGGQFLEITRESIGLVRGADLWSDVDEFRRSLASLTTHGHSAAEICPACLTSLENAARLYPEPFMAGFNLRDSPNFEEWQFFQEETLRRELSGALEKLVFGLCNCGRSEEAVGYARRWLALDPLLEEAHRQLMLLYARTDGRNAALRQYRECVRILDQELGVAPLEETTRLYEAILNREPLPEPEGRLRFLPEAPGGSSADQPAPPTLAASPTAETRTPARPLVGRQLELSQVEEAYRSIHGDGRMVILQGEAGIGKTRLAETFIASARAQGARVIQARCYAGEAGLAYAPFIEGLNAVLALPDTIDRLKALPPGVLAEAGRLMPEIYNLTQPTGDSAQSRFFEALRQVLYSLLAGPRPGVLFLDDLHWADAASLDLLTYLVRRLRGAELLILAAWRSENEETARRLEVLGGELARSGLAARLELRRLSQAEVVDLVRAYPETVDARQAEQLGERLYQESEGLPFVAVEYLSAFAAQGPLTSQMATSSMPSWELPASVRDLLHSRLAGLDAATQQLLSTAAAVGRSFDFTILREASGRSEFETIDGLEKLLATGLVVEQAVVNADNIRAGDIRYNFTHEKLCSLIYEETSLARRRLLHRRIAETLTRQGSRLEQPGLAAYHFTQAGLDAQAAEYYLQAGEHARRLFANVDALAHYQAALAAGHPDAAGIHEAIGDLRTLNGEYSAALSSYHTAAALCTPACLANLEYKLGNVHQRLGEWDLAASHYQASLEALADAPESGFHVHLFANRSLTAHARGDLDAAQALAEQALRTAQAVNDAQALAEANNVLGVLARARNDQEEAIAYLEASLRAAETLDDPLARIAALNNLALVYGEHGNLEWAIHLAGQALDLCQKRGDRHREAALHNNLADLFHRAGREEESMAQLKQAVIIFAEIGAPGEPAQPEIWKLIEW